MKVYHLSHIDLDGYGCQLVSREFFSDIRFYNANYGREVSVRLNLIIDDIASFKPRESTRGLNAANLKSFFNGGFADSKVNNIESKMQDFKADSIESKTQDLAIDSKDSIESKSLNSQHYATLQNSKIDYKLDSKDSCKADSIESKIQDLAKNSIESNFQDSIKDSTKDSIESKSQDSKIDSKETAAKDPKKQKFIILITDLNLTLSECKFLSEQVRDLKLSGLDIEIILLDHHATGLESAEAYEWYRLDINRCATKITYEYLLERYGLNDSKQEWLKPMVEMINSVDIWLEDGFGFEFGKVAMSLIATSNELNRYMFDIESREYKLALLKRAFDYYREYESKDGGLINGKAFDEVAFDNAIFFLKKEALGGDKNSETMDNIISRAQVALLEKKKESCKVYYEDKVGFLSYGMGGISVVANRFLSKNTEFDFYIDVGNRGNVSLRSNGNCDVSALSQACFSGGGHKNASGGRMDGFKESFLYEDIRAQVQDFLDNRDDWE